MTELINDADFKQAQWAIVKTQEQYKVPHVLINVQKLRFSISPALQEWVATEIMPPIIEAGLHKMGYVMPVEFIEKSSMEQIVDEVSETVAEHNIMNPVAFFDNEDDVFAWFRNKYTRSLLQVP